MAGAEAESRPPGFWLAQTGKSAMREGEFRSPSPFQAVVDISVIRGAEEVRRTVLDA